MYCVLDRRSNNCGWRRWQRNTFDCLLVFVWWIKTNSSQMWRYDHKINKCIVVKPVVPADLIIFF